MLAARPYEKGAAMSSAADGAVPVPESPAHPVGDDPPQHGGLRKEFLVERQGRTFALYQGLLDLAHQEGLLGITTVLVQIPSDLNQMTAIVHATVQTERGTFMGLGDANPGNVNRMMVPHLIRLAETRAKARALRDAVNVGVAALEELGGDGADEGPPGPGSWPGRAPTDPDTTAAPRRTGQDPNAPATQQQLDAIARLAGVARVQVATDGMTFGQAADQITQLQKLQPKRGEG